MAPEDDSGSAMVTRTGGAAHRQGPRGHVVCALTFFEVEGEPLLQSISRWLHRRKYGDEVIVVSGLPRSGTSMMMKMLEAGGLPVATDAVRTADEDNPKGYYELERIKDLENERDKSYIAAYRGQVVKVISYLLRFLPDQCAYRVILMRRNLEEVLASQNKMLENRGEENPIEDDRAHEMYENQLTAARILMKDAPNFSFIEVRYAEVVSDPRTAAEKVAAFLEREMDVAAMAGAVDGSLYRNRSQ